MAAPKGNQFWKARSSHGRNPIFEDPEQLWEACVEYFEWADGNPLHEEKVFNGKDGIARTTIAKMRAMTISGLCTFLDISRSTWDEYRSKEGFSGITARVEEIIRDQKFSGAAADLLNANIIARDLGLAEKREHTGEDGKPIQMDMDPRQISRAVLALLGEAHIEEDAGMVGTLDPLDLSDEPLPSVPDEETQDDRIFIGDRGAWITQETADRWAVYNADGTLHHRYADRETAEKAARKRP